MLGERFSMIHITTKDMANFNAVQLPLTPAEKSELQVAARKDDSVTTCPFCHKKMGGSPAVNGHLTRIIDKGGDELHDKEEATKWRDEKKKEILSKRRTKSKKRKADDMGSEDDEVSGDKEKDEASLPKQAKRGTVLKKVGVSNEYERYGNAVFKENE